MTNSWASAGALVVLAIIFAVLALLYWVGAIQFLFGVLAVLALVAANFVRPKNTPDF